MKPGNSTFKLSTILFSVLVAGWCFSEYAAAQGDAPGSADHPMISRYAGSFIDGYEVHGFNEFTLPLGPAIKKNSKRVPSKKVDLEGKITRILYRAPKGRSTLEIFRNYRSALEKGGFEILFSCKEPECGRLFHWLLYHGGKQIKSSKTSGGAFDMPMDIRYLSARLKKNNSIIYASLMVAFDNGFSKLSKVPITLLEVIESKSMDREMVTVDAEAMAQKIDVTGHISIYGIYFDTNSAKIKPESESALKEISKLMGMKPSLKLLVVGHTDNQGGYEHNMGLSKGRAHSVVTTLVGKQGIAANRLKAAGVGYLAPVASNDTDDGRAKNRRVELVKQ